MGRVRPDTARVRSNWGSDGRMSARHAWRYGDLARIRRVRANFARDHVGAARPKRPRYAMLAAPERPIRRRLSEDKAESRDAQGVLGARNSPSHRKVGPGTHREQYSSFAWNFRRCVSIRSCSGPLGGHFEMLRRLHFLVACKGTGKKRDIRRSLGPMIEIAPKLAECMLHLSEFGQRICLSVSNVSQFCLRCARRVAQGLCVGSVVARAPKEDR